MISLRGPKLKIFAAVLALIAIAAGIYMMFFESPGFVKTSATIISMERVNGAGDNDDTFTPTVEYTVNGKTYTGEINHSSGSYKVGKTITVMYDPNDPSVVHGDSRMGIYFICVGALILAVIIVTAVREKKNQREAQEVREMSGRTDYAPSVQGDERELYFLTDIGTPKYGHRI